MTIDRQAALEPLGPRSRPKNLGPEETFTEVLPMGELIEYWCALAVADELHFTHAAKRLHLDQSAVSRHIQKLERKLGIKLFVRASRGVELTEAGEGFMPHARRSLFSASNGERFAQAIARGEAQEFRLAYSPIVSVHLIAQISGLVQVAQNRVPLKFQSVATEKLTERLLDGTSHAAIGILPVVDEIAQTCILRENLFVAMPSTHRLAESHSIHARELTDDPVIWAFGEQDSIVSKHLVGLLRKAGYIPNISLRAQSVAEALSLVREGFGVSLVKASELQLHPEGLVMRPFTEEHLVVETGLLYLADHRWKFLAEFVSLVTQHLRCGDDTLIS
ncbi:MAG TPA: LysR family transcriptional regulator [Chthoniobacterales bacterium]|nr:LysR family transcriptional regulator [Chthoniobacterales bacterium]